MFLKYLRVSRRKEEGYAWIDMTGRLLKRICRICKLKGGDRRQ